jgi:RNA 2',3'-cyclic 3'-phosphodiesterase
MRTFIAIPLPDECKALLVSMQQELRTHGADVRWVAVPSIHLTLKFLGEVEPERIAEMSEALTAVSKSNQQFQLRLHGLGCFPNQKNPRVIWCGVGGEIDALLQLQQKVETACVALGFAREERDFRPHLTLGRVTGKRNLQPLIDYIKIGSGLECSFTANHFNVYKSVLKPQGAIYTVLTTIALGG